MTVSTVHYLSMLKLHDFTLTYSGQTTSALARTATSTQVKNALLALSNLDTGDVDVTGSAGGPYTVTFGGTLANTDVSLITSNRGAISITTGTPGAADTNEVQTVTVVATGGTYTLTYSGQTTAPIAYDASAATVATELKALSNIGNSDVSVSGSAGGPYTVTFLSALAATDVALLTADTTSLTLTAPGAVVTTDTPGVVPVDEVQLLTIDATGGTYTLTYSGQETANIAFDAAAAAVQSALIALSNLAPGDVVVTGSAGGPYTLTFGGTLAGSNVATITTDATNLTGGAHTAVITTPTPGVAAVNEVQKVAVTATGGHFKLSFGGEQTGDIAYDASAAVVATALKALSTVGTGNVTVSKATTNAYTNTYTVTFTGDLAAQNVAALVAESHLTGISKSVTVTTATPGAANTNEIQVITLPHTS